MTDNQKQIQTKNNDVGLIKESHLSNVVFSPYERSEVISNGLKQLNKLITDGNKQICLNSQDVAFQMLTLDEFDRGLLLIQGFGLAYKALVIDLSKQFQAEYECKTASEKSTAHLAAQNYVRTLELQKDLSAILNAENYNDFKLRRYQIVSKAYEQANHQYFLSIQTLRQMKQPQINVTVKTGITNIANNQLIQENNGA